VKKKKKKKKKKLNFYFLRVYKKKFQMWENFFFSPIMVFEKNFKKIIVRH